MEKRGKAEREGSRGSSKPAGRKVSILKFPEVRFNASFTWERKCGHRRGKRATREKRYGSVQVWAVPLDIMSV